MDTAKKLDDAIEFIARSRQALEGGSVVVLDGFQNEVKDICTIIAALPMEEMLQYSSKLEKLMDNLGVLEKELREQQSLVQQEIFKLNRKQNALKSYQTVSHSHKKEEKE